jgi:hypothetical protein
MSVICPLGFYYEDKDVEGYYLREIDIYSGTASKDGRSLSIRKRIKDDVFELYQWTVTGFAMKIVREDKDLAVICEEAYGMWDENVSFASLNAGLQWAGYEDSVTRDQREKDQVCQHKYPTIDTFSCPEAIKRQRDDNSNLVLPQLLKLQSEARKKYEWIKV